MAPEKSIRRTIRETRDESDDKLTICQVSGGVDWAFKQVKPHFIYSKHRGGHVKEEVFGSLDAAENKLLEKKANGAPVMFFP